MRVFPSCGNEGVGGSRGVGGGGGGRESVGNRLMMRIYVNFYGGAGSYSCRARSG